MEEIELTTSETSKKKAPTREKVFDGKPFQSLWESSGENLVLPIAFEGGALEVPASRLGERLDCACRVRVSAVGNYMPSFL